MQNGDGTKFRKMIVYRKSYKRDGYLPWISFIRLFGSTYIDNCVNIKKWPLKLQNNVFNSSQIYLACADDLNMLSNMTPRILG